MKPSLTANIPLTFLLALATPASGEHQQLLSDARLTPGSLKELIDTPTSSQPVSDKGKLSKTRIAQNSCIYGHWRRC
jgi:hypothetical protein